MGDISPVDTSTTQSLHLRIKEEGTRGMENCETVARSKGPGHLLKYNAFYIRQGISRVSLLKQELHNDKSR